MANQPHDKSGKKCFLCKRPFTVQTATFTIAFKKKGFIEHGTVCASCHHRHHEKGEV